MNPFKLCDELIKQKYRIPVFKNEIKYDARTDDWRPYSLDNNHVDLGELLLTIRELYSKNLAELNKYKSERGSGGVLQFKRVKV